MLNLNTNLSSIIAQRSLSGASLRLNQAIERMTTGYKINHASDNAANYSISTNMSVKISSYQVAEDNVSMGMDLLNVASDSLSQIDDKLARLRALQEYAMNGTYGEKSLNAINVEANAIVDEIQRLYATTEYNGINLFGAVEVEDAPQKPGMPSSNAKFIKAVQIKDTNEMDKFADVAETTAISSGTYSISLAADLEKLAAMTNNGLITGGEFVLSNDINLSGIADFVAIGTDTTPFQGIFDGNGYTISNMKQANPDEYGGLFASTNGAEIKNLSLNNIDIKSTIAGALVTMSQNTTIENCCVSGKMSEGMTMSGMVAMGESITIKDSYSDVDVIGGLVETDGSIYPYSYNTSGLVLGLMGISVIDNCYVLGDTSNALYGAGGLVAQIATTSSSNITIKDCAVLGNVSLSKDTLDAINNIDDLPVLSGAIIGAIIDDGTGFLTDVTLENCSYNKTATNLNAVGAYSPDNTANYITDVEGLYDLGNPQGKTELELKNAFPNLSKPTGGTVQSLLGDMVLQVGIDASENSQISLNTSFVLKDLEALRGIGVDDTDYLSQIDEMKSIVSAKQTEYGAVQNRLDSALDEISTQYENLISSRSTLKDADIAKVSSQYIQQQILQQASATLLYTANQTPALALQLL